LQLKLPRMIISKGLKRPTDRGSTGLISNLESLNLRGNITF
jgi:hypothetical protein